MAEIKVLTLVGGISQGSLNKKLFRTTQEMAKPGLDLQLFDIASLPFFSQDIENQPPPAVLDFWKQIDEHPAVLFITPEYNHSFPGVLKNALDWGSRPPGKGHWKNKPAAMMGASAGNIGTFGAQQHLRLVLSYLDMRTMQQPEFYLNGSKAFDEKGQMIDPGSVKFMHIFIEALTKWYQSHL